MTLDETTDILGMLKANYPGSFRNMTGREGQDMLNLWADAFKNIPFQLVKVAVTSVIMEDTREFAPNIGQVNARIKDLLLPDTEREVTAAWEKVIRFIRNYHQEDYREHYEELPRRIRAVLTITDIREIANATDTTIKSVAKSRFYQQYKHIKENEENLAITTGNLASYVDTAKLEQIGLPPLTQLEAPK